MRVVREVRLLEARVLHAVLGQGLRGGRPRVCACVSCVYKGRGVLFGARFFFGRRDARRSLTFPCPTSPRPASPPPPHTEGSPWSDLWCRPFFLCDPSYKDMMCMIEKSL